MKREFRLLLGILATALVATAAPAQPGPAMAGAGPGGGDCAQARDPGRCEALRMAKASCKDKAPAEKRQCLQSSVPPMDCAKARNPLRCEERQRAGEICKDKVGRAHHQCMRANLPKSGGRGTAAAPRNTN